MTTQEEYSNRMSALLRKQNELKVQFCNKLEDYEANVSRQCFEIREQARVVKRQMRDQYRSQQLDLEMKKQALKAEWTKQKEGGEQ